MRTPVDKESKYGIDKKVINYYASFYEVAKQLSVEQFYEFNMAIFDVMFFKKHIDDIEFDDAMVKILWDSVKHSAKSSVNGFCSKRGIPYDSVFEDLSNPLANPLSNPLTNPLANKEKGKEKGKEKENKLCTIQDSAVGSESKVEHEVVSKVELNDRLKDDFETIWKLHSEHLSGLQTERGNPRRNTNKKGTFERYKVLRKKYSMLTLSVIARASTQAFATPELYNVFGRKFDKSLADVVNRQDDKLLYEVLDSNDKDFMDFVDLAVSKGEV